MLCDGIQVQDLFIAHFHSQRFTSAEFSAPLIWFLPTLVRFEPTCLCLDALGIVMNALSVTSIVGPYPQCGWDFPEEIPKKFQKDPGNALRAFPGIPLESTAGMPQTLYFKAFEASRAFPELSPPQYGWGRLFFQKWFWRGPLRAAHGIPSSTEGISEL